MLPGTGLVDTAVIYHQSVYANVAGFNADQLSAMPSVHIGWAILVAIAIITTAHSKWRWLALLYPAMTTLAVIVTANHFWLDGVAAAVILAARASGPEPGQAAHGQPDSRRGGGSGRSGAGSRGGYGRPSSITMPSVAARTGATVAS